MFALRWANLASGQIPYELVLESFYESLELMGEPFPQSSKDQKSLR